MQRYASRHGGNPVNPLELMSNLNSDHKLADTLSLSDFQFTKFKFKLKSIK